MGDCESPNNNRPNGKRMLKFVDETPAMTTKHPRTTQSQLNGTPRSVFLQQQPPSSHAINNVIDLNNENSRPSTQNNSNNDHNEHNTNNITSSPPTYFSFAFHGPSPPMEPFPTTTTTTTATTATPTTAFTIRIPSNTNSPNPSIQNEVIEIADNNDEPTPAPLVIDLTEDDTPLNSESLSTSTTTTTSSSPYSGTRTVPISPIPLLNNDLINSSLGNLTTILSYISRLTRSNSNTVNKTDKPEVVVINEDNDENKKQSVNGETKDDKKKPQTPAPEENLLGKLTCSICLENVKDPTATTCGHIYCQKCIQSALKKSRLCPLCRKKCTPGSLVKLYNS
eukprot:TRINITY_DN4061_c0_g1_i1.p1 TRINITY_DN4061_c0_g1~~TRINITY_DN4061_c0_g1_i1.p1  ORF type:complete len:338 (+),score=85.93 TRINITY_DN4061_c0_g1_i1:258-1271(+)